MLNTGISTLAPVDRALTRLDVGRVKHLRIYGGPRYRGVARQLTEQGHGSHADELETSLMLALAPQLVDMARAEASPTRKQQTPGALTPSDPDSPNYSRSGSYGDPTLATSAKGEVLLAAMLDDLNEQMASFWRKTPHEAAIGHDPKRVVMRSHLAFRWIVVAAVIGPCWRAPSFRADAQSEYMRGDRMPYDAFDRLPTTDLEVSGGTIHVAFAPGDIALPREKVLDWVRMSAKAVTTYYGRFPVNSLRLLLVPVDGARIRGGTTWGYRGAAIRLPFGRDSTEDVLGATG